MASDSDSPTDADNADEREAQIDQIIERNKRLAELAAEAARLKALVAKRSSPAMARIVALKRLHALWTTELQELLRVHAEVESNHTEALDDLAAMIRRLESE